MTIQPWFAGLILFVASVADLQAQSNLAPPRLAILAIDPVLGDANDVLTAVFSKRQGVVLLERAQIEKVYREQQLSVANQDLIKLGQVLGADGLAYCPKIRTRAFSSGFSVIIVQQST